MVLQHQQQRTHRQVRRGHGDLYMLVGADGSADGSKTEPHHRKKEVAKSELDETNIRPTSRMPMEGNKGGRERE